MFADFISRHRAGVLLLVFATFSLLCMTLRIDAYVMGAKTATWYLFSPGAVYSGQFFNKLDSLKGGLFRLVRVDGENSILREQNALLAKRAMERDALEEENNRLRGLLELKKQSFSQAIPAAVIGRDWREWFHAAVLDKGVRDNVVFSAAVVTGQNDTPSLVGRILEVGETTSKVLLLTDAVSAISAKIEGRDEIGLLEGRNKTWVSLNYLAQTSQVQPGDKVVTAGLGGVFPPGIPIGTVESLSSMPDGYFKTARVVPFASLTSVREVLVLQRKTLNAEEEKK
jgi:rod shape-determining protein MreC